MGYLPYSVHHLYGLVSKPDQIDVYRLYYRAAAVISVPAEKVSATVTYQ